MSGNPPLNIVDSPGVQMMIPLLYAAWSDRVLSPAEVRELQKKAADFSFLTESDRAVLLEWTNPGHPPSRQLFKQWEIQLKDVAGDLVDGHESSLTEIGLELARRAIEKQNSEGASLNELEAKAALADLEEALVLINWDTYWSLFPTEEKRDIDTNTIGSTTNALATLLDGPYRERKEKMRTLLSDPFFAYQQLPLKEEYREQVLVWLQELAKRGLGAISYPTAYGGEDRMDQYAAVFEMLGHHDLSLAIKFGVQFGLFGGSVLALGTARHHDAYLEKIGKGELLGCFAMTETGHGSNVRGLETTANYDPEQDEFIINSPSIVAGKEYIGNALHGSMGSVFAQLIVNGENHGVHAILVPLRNENGNTLTGIRIEDNGYKLGLNGVDNGRIWFDQVRVPRTNLLNRFGDVDADGNYTSPIENPSKRFFTMLGTLVGGRVCVPRAGLSAAKSALTIAIRYALKRRQFSPSATSPEMLIMDYPSHQRRLIPLLAKAYALHFGLDHLLDQYVNHEGEDFREIETLAAGMKSYVTWYTTETIQECREACGGKGYLAENRFAALKADTDIFTTFEGDNTVLMQLVGRGLLTNFRKAFNEEGAWALLRYLGQRVNTAITVNPISIRNTDSKHLRDMDWLLSALQYREQKLTFSLAQRLRSLIKDGISAFEAGLRCQTHLLALAESYIELIISEQFAKVVREQKDTNLASIIEKVFSLHALYTIEKRKGWYLENDFLAGAKSKAVRREIDQLCSELRPHLSTLLDAFQIPQPLLGAQILE